MENGFILVKLIDVIILFGVQKLNLDMDGKYQA